jgi:putative membrane protein
MKKHLKKFGSGILIGISNLIPGFSGGTMALILGILEEFTDAVSLFTKHPLKSIKELWSLGLGMVIGIIIATFTVVVCLEKWPIITASFFVGLVLASMRIALKEIKGETPKISDYISALICFLVSISLPFLKKLGFEINILNPNILIMIYIFVVACIAAATMMIPAASGSLIMLAFGIFASILKELKDTLSCLVNLDFMGIISHFDVLIPFGLGCVFGVILVSKFMSYAFKKHKSKIWYGISGLLISSIYTIYYDAYESHIINNLDNFMDNIIINLILSLIMITVAYVGLNFIIKYSDKLNSKKEENESINEEKVA